MSVNKLVIFDLDGVLVDTKELHYDALNKALEAKGHSPISLTDHLSKFDGKSTKEKLKMLEIDDDEIWDLKQRETMRKLDLLDEDNELIEIMKYIKAHNYKIAVASNSIRQTVYLVLHRLGLIPYIDLMVSNEDVKLSKPNPEMYWKCMTELNASPDTTWILEDSHVGREGATKSGAHLVPIIDREDVTLAKIKDLILYPENTRKVPWVDKKMNVLIPMAGEGSRFSAMGYTFPKPLIEVRGKPMIQVVVENLNIEAHYIFIVRKEHYEKYSLQYLLNMIAPGCDIVQVDSKTEGAACTSLLAKDLIDNGHPLLIANSDQFVEWDSNRAMYSITSSQTIDGGIMTFTATHPKWSYVKLDEKGLVSEVAEKKVISDMATVGIYWWRQGSDYVRAAEKMITANDRTNGEFYIAPAFNYAIKDKIWVRPVPIEKMWGIGTPEDLNYFLENYKGTV